MRSDADVEAFAVLHYGPVKDDVEQTPTDRFANVGIGLELAERLWDRGIMTFISRGVGSYTAEEVKLWTPDNSPLTMGLEELGVIRDIGGGFRDGTNPTVAAVDAKVPILNGPRVRQLDDKAYVAHEKLFGSRQPQTEVVDALPGTTAEVDMLLGDQFTGVVYAKPARGAAAKGVFRLDRLSADYQQTLDRLVREGQGRPYLLQAAIDNTIPLPAEIKPENEAQAQVLEAYADAPKELRIFWFYGEGQELRWLPVLRVKPLRMHTAEATAQERYVFIDPDTVPRELLAFTQAVLDKFAHKVGVAEMSGAMDFAFGVAGAEREAQWWVMEGNAWQPVQPSEKEHPRMHRAFVDETVTQMARIAIAR